MTKKGLKSPGQAREEIESQGISIAEWAHRNGLSPRPVYDVLNGRNRGNFGEAHRAAVLLGLKEDKQEKGMRKACALCGKDSASEKIELALYLKDGRKMPVCRDCARSIILSFAHLIQPEKKREAAHAG